MTLPTVAFFSYVNKLLSCQLHIRIGLYLAEGRIFFFSQNLKVAFLNYVNKIRFLVLLIDEVIDVVGLYVEWLEQVFYLVWCLIL